MVLESLELFGLMHVSSFASIIKNINELICVKYLKHGRHLININFLFSAWVSGPTHYFSLENLRGEIGSILTRPTVMSPIPHDNRGSLLHTLKAIDCKSPKKGHVRKHVHLAVKCVIRIDRLFYSLYLSLSTKW